MPKKLKNTLASKGSPIMAFQAAEEFLKNASLYFAKIPPELNAAAFFTNSTFGAFIAANTNLALSAELFLKCAARLAELSVIYTHDLLKLYDTLPVKVKAEIERAYNSRVSAIPPTGRPVAIEIALTANNKPASEDAIAKLDALKIKVNDLRSLLSVEKDAFVNWRYFFQESPDGEVSLFRSEYVKLQLFVEVLREHIAVILQTRLKLVFSATQPPMR